MERYIQQSFQYGEEFIHYTVYFIPNQKSTAIINVHPNGLVLVKAPKGTSTSDVKKAVYKRARWVTNTIRKITEQQLHVIPRHYISGECHFYLGRRYTLKIFKSNTINQRVKLTRGQLQIYAPSHDSATIKNLLVEWYRIRAEIVFNRRLEALVPEIRWLKTTPPCKLRIMKKQWGSCSPNGTLNLNLSLVKAPRECIDYVIFHELCHLKEHNHSVRFYKLLKQQMPDWKIIKEKLDNLAELLLVE